MPQSAYSPEADEKNAPVKDTSTNQNTPAGKPYSPLGHDVAANDSSDPRRDAPQTGESDGVNSTPGLKNAEEEAPRNPLSAGSASDGAADSKFYNAGGDNQGRFSNIFGGTKNGRNKLARGLKNKWFLGALGGGGLGILGLVILIAILLSSLELPNVMQHIETYEFARLSRQFSQSAQRVNEEALQVDAATEGTAAEGASAADPGGFFGVLKDSYQGLQTNVNNIYQGVRENTWGKFDDFRPNQVIQKLGKTNDLELRFRTSKLTGRQIFTGGSVDGADFNVEPLTGFAKWTPGLRAIMRTNNVAQTYSELLPAIAEAEKANRTAFLVRGGVELDIIKATGGNTAGYILSKFKTSGSNGEETEAENDAEVMDETYNNSMAGATVADNASTGELQQADSAAEQSEKNDMAKLANGNYDYNDFLDYNLGDLAQADNSDPYTEYVQSIIDDNASKAAAADITPSLTETVEENANPVSGLAIPACIIYDGSVQQSGPPINNEVNEQQDTFLTLASEADEQEAGGPTGADKSGSLGAAIAATHDQLGNISQSNPEILADGGTIDTSDTPSAEAGSDGGYNYSIFNALTNISPDSLPGEIVGDIVGGGCSVLTNSYVLGGGALVNIGVAIASLGSVEAAEETAGQGVRDVVQQFAKNVASNAGKQLTKKVVVKDGVKTIERGALNRVSRFIFKQGIILGGTYGATVLANLIVEARAGIENNGVAQGTSLVNEAMCGANIQAGENERHGLFGRPLTESEVTQSDAADSQFIAYQNESQGFSQRYLSPHNANSLTSHIALAMDSEAQNGILATLSSLAGSILNPVNLFSSLVSTVDGSVLAAPSPSTQDCGDIQFGWSQTEESAIDGNQSYRPLPNEKVLSDSGEAAAIAQEYAKCFGYSADSTGALTSNINGDGSLGTLLANADIQRDSDGNVLEGTAPAPNSKPTNPYEGDCSPSSLGIGNDAFGPQMVFRWRLAQQYDLTLDQLLNAQKVTTATPTTTTAPVAASGSAQQLATQILANKNISLSGTDVMEDVQDAAKGQNGSAGAMTSAALLGLIATVGQSHTVTISAIQSGGTGHCIDSAGVAQPKSVCPSDPHYNGDAVDFSELDGVSITGRNAPAITIMKLAFSALPHGSGFGQNECGSEYSTNSELPNGDITFDDSCNHLHVQVPAGTP